MWITGTSGATEKQDNVRVVKHDTTPQGTQTVKVTTGQNIKGTVSSLSGENIVLSGVSLNISEDGKKKLEEQSTQLEMLQMQLEQMQEQTEASEEGWDSMGKCLTIALRISAGDNVPISDMEYLREHNSELYMQAMSLRMPKKDPEDYDSILEEEEEGSSDGEESNAKVVESGSSIGSADGVAEIASPEAASDI